MYKSFNQKQRSISPRVRCPFSPDLARNAESQATCLSERTLAGEYADLLPRQFPFGALICQGKARRWAGNPGSGFSFRG